MIQFLKHKDINKEKWDESINNSPNGIVYAYSWYLDIVSPGWSALVEGDYRSVMPLPQGRKLGFSFVYTPFFVQQLGVFSIAELSDVDKFVEAVPKQFKFIEQNLNEANKIVKGNWDLNFRTNYKLSIKDTYEDIRKGYKRNCRRNINKSEKAELTLRNDVSPSVFRTFIFDNLIDQLDGIKKTDFDILEKLTEEVLDRGKGEVVGLFDMENNMHAVGLYLFSNDRLIFSVCASSEYGKANQAMSKLVDFQIEKYAGKFRWYDFSGSNDKGIAYFNSTFGAEKVEYINIKLNRLPGILKRLKQ